MPELAMDAFNMNSIGDEPSGSYTPRKESFTQQGSPRSPWSPRSLQSDSIDLAIDGAVDNSIEQLYNNVCEMQSSDQSPSRASFGSFGGESRIDSELRQLVGDIPELETTKEVVTESKEEYNGNDLTPEKENVSTGKNSTKKYDNEASSKSRPTSNSSYQRPPIDNRHKKNSRKPNAVSHMKKQRKLALLGANFRNGIGDDEVELDNRDLGPFLLKQTREMISSGENPQTALDLGLRALKSFEKRAGEKPNLELVMCLHILAAIYCSLGQYNEAIPALERSIDIPVIEDGQDHALAKFAGCMQLGDTYAMLGRTENSSVFYTAGLEIQRRVLGDIDFELVTRVAMWPSLMLKHCNLMRLRIFVRWLLISIGRTVLLPLKKQQIGDSWHLFVTQKEIMKLLLSIMF